MKKIFLLLNIFAVCLLASCNKNEFATFNDKDAFVAFGKASYAIAEDGTSLTIPVTLASVAGIETTVTVSGVDGTAVNGVDYAVKNGGNLVFNAQTRTANVEIEIFNRPGEYTGDISFTLQFSNLGGVNAGFQSTTTITIQDNDHPLSPILGTYNVTGTSYFNGPTNTYMVFEKDATDETKVWIRNLFCNPGFDIAETALYGVVKYWKKSRDKENKGRNCHTLPAQVGETETRKLLESRTIGAPRVRYSQEVAHFDSDDRNLH